MDDIHSIDLMNIKNAKAGYQNDSRNLIGEISHQIENDNLSPAYKSWIVRALRDISHGADPRQTLIVKRKLHNPAISARNRSVYLALQKIKLEQTEINITNACEQLIANLGLNDPITIGLKALLAIHQPHHEEDDTNLISLYLGLSTPQAMTKAYREVAESYDKEEYESIDLYTKIPVRPLFLKGK